MNDSRNAYSDKLANVTPATPVPTSPRLDPPSRPLALRTPATPRPTSTPTTNCLAASLIHPELVAIQSP
jgi:hypothetical protein